MTTYDDETWWMRMLRRLGSCPAVPWYPWAPLYTGVRPATRPERPDDRAGSR